MDTETDLLEKAHQGQQEADYIKLVTESPLLHAITISRQGAMGVNTTELTDLSLSQKHFRLKFFTH
jgi:hypothetical protein